MTPAKLKKARKEQGVSQFALSKATGISRDKITKFECGYTKITKEEKLKIKEHLKC